MTEEDHRRSIAAVYEEQVGRSNPILMLLHRYIPERGPIFGSAVIATVLWRITMLLPPYLLGVTVDAFFATNHSSLSVPFVPQAWMPASTKGQFAFLMGLFVVVMFSTQVLQGIRLITWRWFQQSVLHDLRTSAYDATQRLSMAFFETEQTGDVMSVLNNDINQLESLLQSGLRRIIDEAAFFVGLLVIMLGLHWQLTMVALAFLPITLGIVYLYQRVIEPRYDERRTAVGTLNAHLQNAVTGIETIKAFTNEGHEHSRLETHSHAYWRADWNAAKIKGLFDPVRMGVTNAAMLTVIIVGGWWALFGLPFGFGTELSGGTFVTFYFYSSMFVAHVSRVGDIVDTYVDAKASAKRVFGLVHHPSTVTEDSTATSMTSIDGRVAYDDVTFTYPGTETPALREVSFEVAPNDFVGVVGPTGAGKSTVLKLLLRFYDPDRGTITVDGMDIQDVTVESLRGAIGYVSQEPFLFDGTVRENITYSDKEAHEEAVLTAAKRANIHEFITDLPDGYDTEVGERGVKLSGGQRQRIAIARTIFHDPELLILDEATSHVDNRTELLIQESLADLVAGRTTVAIAHRLSTVRAADQLLVLNHGEIVERGTHEELVDQRGLYAELWEIHLGKARATSAVDVEHPSAAGRR